jgi:hypothetical protein
MTLLQKEMGLIELKNATAIEFCNKWSCKKKVDFINTMTKSIKKVQNNCSLLALYIKYKDDKKFQKIKGYVFDRQDLNDKSKTDFKYKYKYNVYVPEYSMVTTFKTNVLMENNLKMLFTLHLFNDESSLKQKIRLQLV